MRDIPYTGLASFVGKPVDGLPVSFHGFLNNRVPFDSFVGALADVSTLLNPDADAPEELPLLPMVAGVLETVVSANQQHQLASRQSELQGSEPQLTVFHGQRAPPISIQDYLVRIAKYTKCSPAAFIHALAHLMRLAEKHESLRLTGLNVHRLVLTGVMLSAKFLDDRYFNNAFYAKVGGVSTIELNRLEMEMLTLLDFRLLVTPEDVQQLLYMAQSGRLAGLMLAVGGVHLVPPPAACSLGALPELADVTASVMLGAMAGAAPGVQVPAWGEVVAAAPALMSAVANAALGGVGSHQQQQHHHFKPQGQAAVGALVQTQQQHRKRRSGSLELHEAECRPRMAAYHRRSMEMVAACAQ